MLAQAFLFSILSLRAFASYSRPALGPGFVYFDDIVITNGTALESREPGGVFITTDANWKGQTGFAKQPFDICIVLTSPWYHTISSLGPDTFNAVVISEDNACQGNAATIFNPGVADLTTIGWNDRIGSFRVRQIPGANCIGFDDSALDSGRYPGINCNRCCGGCTRDGESCCPQGLPAGCS